VLAPDGVCMHGDGVTATSRPQEVVAGVQLGSRKLPASTAALVATSSGGMTRRSLAPMAASALCRGAAHGREEAAVWGFKGAERRRPSRTQLGRREAARRQRDALGLQRVRVRHEADGSAKWGCAAGSWLGWCEPGSGLRARPSPVG
jgi:hypothetical protein